MIHNHEVPGSIPGLATSENLLNQAGFLIFSWSVLYIRISLMDNDFFSVATMVYQGALRL